MNDHLPPEPFDPVAFNSSEEPGLLATADQLHAHAIDRIRAPDVVAFQLTLATAGGNLETYTWATSTMPANHQASLFVEAAEQARNNFLAHGQAMSDRGFTLPEHVRERLPWKGT